MTRKHNPWLWVPSLYFAEGLPYIIANNTFTIVLFDLGVSNTYNAIITSWMNLPWIIKPLWSPIVEFFKTKRWWILFTQLIMGVTFASIGLFIPIPSGINYGLALMWLLAFSSATHDIAADGFYIDKLETKNQAAFVGIRNTFYRVAMVFGQGLLVVLAGHLKDLFIKSSSPQKAITDSWSIVFFIVAAIYILIFIYHSFTLPKNTAVVQVQNRPMEKSEKKSMLNLLKDFFSKPYILISILFILFYRFSEAQLNKLASPFLLDNVANGGLAMKTQYVGWIYGTVGLISLLLGGILGGLFLSRKGLKRCLWIMAILMNIPNVVYLILSLTQPQESYITASLIAVEQFGYGFGFSSLTYFMMLLSRGTYATSHYAICTAFMSVGMMLPGMASGFIQSHLGYTNFFIWILFCTIPSFIVTYLISSRLPSEDSK